MGGGIRDIQVETELCGFRTRAGGTKYTVSVISSSPNMPTSESKIEPNEYHLFHISDLMRSNPHNLLTARNCFGRLGWPTRPSLLDNARGFMDPGGWQLASVGSDPFAEWP